MGKVFLEMPFLTVCEELELMFVDFRNNNKIQLAKILREREKEEKTEFL